MEVTPNKLVWQILSEALRLGREAEEMFEEAKKNGVLLNRGRRQKRKRAQGNG